jgi:hypothetical protein
MVRTLANESLRLINGGKNDGEPATVAEIAALQFDGVKELAQLSEKQRDKNLTGLIQSVYAAAQIAGAIVTHDKAKLIEVVSEQYDTFGPALMELADARANAQATLEIIRSGEARLAVALAVIEGDDE